MAAKPSQTAEFANGAAPGRAVWPTAKAVAGYALNELFPSADANGIFNLLGSWTAYLNDYQTQHNHRADGGDYSSPKIDPNSEVDWGANGVFTQLTDTATEVVYSLFHDNPPTGSSLLVMDRIRAVQHQFSSAIRGALVNVAAGDDYIDFTSDGAITDITLRADGVAVRNASKIGGSSKDLSQTLYRGNLPKAVYQARFSDDGAGDLAEDHVYHSYNMSFTGPTAGGSSIYEWDLTDTTGVLGMVRVTIEPTSGKDVEFYRAAEGVVGGNQGYWDTANNDVRLGINRYTLQGGTPPTYADTKLETLTDNSIPAGVGFIITIEVF